MQTQQRGFDFENKIQKVLLKTKRPVYRERDNKQRCGQSISGISHLIELDNVCICIKTRYQQTLISNHEVMEFINCVNNLSMILMKKCVGIIISNVDFSIVAQQQINMENLKNQNHYTIIFDSDFVQLMRKIYFYFHSNGVWFYDGEDSMMVY